MTSTTVTRARLPLNTFGIAFGTAGLAGTWTTAGELIGAPTWTGDAVWAVAAAAWAIITVTYLRRSGRLRGIAEDLRHPVLGPFGSLFPASDVATAVKPLKALQDTLGTFQDTEVQAHALEEMADRLVERGAPAATLLALGAVIEGLHARGAAARVEFASRFATFDGHAVGKAYERLSEDAEELA